MSVPLDVHIGLQAEEQPVPRFIKLILHEAIKDKVDEIVFVLDMKREVEVRTQQEQLMARGKINTAFTDSDSKTFSISFRIKQVAHDLAPVPGLLFEPAMRILLQAAEIPYWTKGEVCGEVETCNPASRWKLTSKDLTARVELKRIP